MAAPSKTFTVIANTSVDPDSPLDTVLMTALRDNDIHLEEWLGKNYTAAVDHNHDGTNSAAIETGFIAKNGSWEDGVDAGWTYNDYTGGSHAIETTNHSHGAQAVAITSTVLANGGGTATKNEYWTVGSSKFYPLEIYIHASATLVSSKVELGWYDSSQSLISTATLLSLTDTPTSRTRYCFHAEAPSTARYAKLVLTGGVPATGTNTGTIYFDGVSFNEVATGWMKISSSGNLSSTSQVDFTLLNDVYDKYMIKVIDVDPSANGALAIRISQDGGSTFKTGSNNYSYAGDYIDNASTRSGYSSNSAARIAISVLTSTTDLGVSGNIYLNNPSVSQSDIIYDMSRTTTGAAIYRHTGSGKYTAAGGGFNAIRIYPTAGNMSSGKIELWGMPK